MKTILSVFVIVESSGFRLYQARPPMPCDDREILQGANPAELANHIKEKAKKTGEDIGVNFRRPIEVLVTGKGKLSSERYDRLERQEKIDFLSQLRKDD